MNIKELVKRSTLVIAGLLVVALAVTGCAPATPDPDPDPEPVTITVGGSTTVQPLAEVLALNYTATRPHVDIEVAGGGTGAGIRGAADGTIQIGMASRALRGEELGLGLVSHVIARDGIVVIVHPAQNITGLNRTQIRNIFAGNITNWSEVGGANATIIVISREEGSGTRTAFEEMVMRPANITGGAILLPSNGAIRTAVAGDSNSIGYVSFGFLDPTVQALAIDGVPAALPNLIDGTYPIVRPLIFLTKGEPTGAVKEFIDWVLGPAGQTIIQDEDYIPV